jgi:methionyl-tRNA formyltransferase
LNPGAQRIVFAGSPAFAVVQLQALLDADLPVVGVLSQPDRPAGRRRRLTPTPVRMLAEERGLPVATPPGLRRAENRAALEAMAPDLIVVAAYGLLLPPEVLELPAAGCLNVHASLLPRWRGAAPVERAIMAGDRHTGTCIMQMDEGLDTGDVRLARSLEIDPAETGAELEQRLARLGAEALLEVITDPGAHPPRPQAEEGVTYAARLGREDARIDFTRPAVELSRQILALSPRLPVTVADDDGRVRLRLLRARPEADGADAAPGTLIAIDAGGLRLATGNGCLTILEAQLVGGKGSILAGADLANAVATRVSPGARLDAV